MADYLEEIGYFVQVYGLPEKKRKCAKDLKEAINSADAVLLPLPFTKDEKYVFSIVPMKETIDDIGKKTAYVHIDETDAGNPKIELGKANNESKLVLTNEDIQFVVGSEVPTKVTSEGLDTDKIKVDNEFAMGRFVWKNRKNGNLGLSWKGVKS